MTLSHLHLLRRSQYNAHCGTAQAKKEVWNAEGNRRKTKENDDKRARAAPLKQQRNYDVAMQIYAREVCRLRVTMTESEERKRIQGEDRLRM